MNKLVIAEKPSVGRSIAAVLGAAGREGELIFRTVCTLAGSAKPMKPPFAVPVPIGWWVSTKAS